MSFHLKNCLIHLDFLHKTNITTGNFKTKTFFVKFTRIFQFYIFHDFVVFLSLGVFLSSVHSLCSCSLFVFSCLFLSLSQFCLSLFCYMTTGYELYDIIYGTSYFGLLICLRHLLRITSSRRFKKNIFYFATCSELQYNIRTMEQHTIWVDRRPLSVCKISIQI